MKGLEPTISAAMRRRIERAAIREYIRRTQAAECLRCGECGGTLRKMLVPVYIHDARAEHPANRACRGTETTKMRYVTQDAGPPEAGSPSPATEG